MIRGTFANVRLRNQMAPGTEGGWTTHLPTGEVTSIYEASLRYKKAGTPTIVIAGSDYGMGSSRDWAAKGSQLLGVRAVLAESFETHPPQQPGGHGRAAAPVQGRRDGKQPGPDRQRKHTPSTWMTT